MDLEHTQQANPGPQIVTSDILLWREVMTSTRFLRKKMADVMTGKNRFFSALKGCFCDKGPPVRTQRLSCTCTTLLERFTIKYRSDSAFISVVRTRECIGLDYNQVAKLNLGNLKKYRMYL
ncbi:hypothetical protein Bbelb_420810 [Branchiostoma belcheri]|nr:hypothetical protein Bbelb_420810 [Branchiostoma belcheri]